MNTEFVLQDKQLQLHRWPLGQKNRSLQAWDSADEYLISYVTEQKAEQQLITNSSKMLIINDSFGALSCYFHHLQPVTLIDSYVSSQGINHNIDANGLNPNAVTLLPSNQALPDDIDIILVKIPKNNAYLTYLLASIATKYNADTTIIAAGKTTDIHNSTLKLFEQYIGPTTTSLAKKKSRLIFSTLENKKSDNNKPIKTPEAQKWQLPGSKLAIFNQANVFSGDSLDIGARLFIQHLPNCDNQTVIDLGCGNGVIAANVMQLFNPSAVKLVDESYMAVSSAKQTLHYNFPERMQTCEFIVDDCLTKQNNNSADVVLCNPPFHQQQAVTDHIAWQMFKDAYRVLRPNGRLCIVGNRNLGYHVKLKRLFGHCEQIASNKKFVILQTHKRR